MRRVIALDRHWLLAAAVVLAVAFAAPAMAGTDDPIGDVPALGEYIEDVPTARGPKPTAVPQPKSKPQTRPAQPQPAPPTLSARIERQIDAQPESVARHLRRITSSPRYGAPETKPPPAARARVQRVLQNEPDSSAVAGREAFRAAFTTAATSGDSHLAVLLLVILLSTAAAIVLASIKAFASGRRR